MVTLHLYQPRIPGHTIGFPSCWNDLTHQEIRDIARIMLNQTPENVDTIKPQIFKALVTGRARKYLDPNWYPNPDDYQQAADALGFIFTKNDRTTTPEPIQTPLRTYQSRPFKEITCGEFEDVEMQAHAFVTDNDISHLATLMAMLCRPRKAPYMHFHSDDNTYSVYKHGRAVKYFSSLPSAQLYAYFIWYSGNCAQLPKMFPTVYNTGKSEGGRDPFVFTKTIHAGAGPKNGTRQQIRAMPLYEFLFDMEQEAVKAQELQRQYDDINRQNS